MSQQIPDRDGHDSAELWMKERREEYLRQVEAGPARMLELPPMPGTGRVYWIAQCLDCRSDWGLGTQWGATQDAAEHNQLFHKNWRGRDGKR